jgi:iron(III) transport system substrate-binding protein
MEFRSSVRRLLGAASLTVAMAAACTAGATPTPVPQTTGTPSPGGSDLQTLIDGAKSEGKITLYTTLDPENGKLLSDLFEQTYPGVTIEWVESNTNPLVQRILTEAKAGTQIADAVQTGDFTVYNFIRENLLDTFSVPEQSSSAVLKAIHHPEGYWTGYELIGAGVAWNTQRVTNPPKTWDDLADPRFANQIILNPDDVDVYTPVGVHKFKGEGAFKTWLDKVAANKPTFQEGHDNVAGVLAAGGAGVYGTAFLNNIAKLKKDGAPVDYAIEETVVKTQVMAVFKNAPHPNAARLWVNFMLTKPAQEIIRQVGRIPVRTDVETDVKLLADSEDKRYYTTVDVIQQAEAYEKIWNDTFGF